MKRILALLLALTLTCGCLAGAALAAEEPGGLFENGTARYRLTEEAAVDIGGDEVPLSAPPRMCCALHFVLMLGALAVAVYYAHDRKARQERMYEMRLIGVM